MKQDFAAISLNYPMLQVRSADRKKQAYLKNLKNPVKIILRKDLENKVTGKEPK